MKRIFHLGAASALALTMQGCAVYAPANDQGAAVRQVMMAQTIAPVQRADSAADGAAAVAAYGNYQRSFVTPVPQSDSAAFGGK